MADIYDSQNEVLLQEGLGGSIDKDDLKAKLASLKPAWEVIAPGFHCSKTIVQKFPLNALSCLPGKNMASRNVFLQMR